MRKLILAANNAKAQHACLSSTEGDQELSTRVFGTRFSLRA